MYWQRVIGMVFILAACHRYGMNTGRNSCVWCVYWQHVLVWCEYRQHVIGKICVQAACHMYGVCTGRVS